jgi:molecular chaperone GrpE
MKQDNADHRSARDEAGERAVEVEEAGAATGSTDDVSSSLDPSAQGGGDPIPSADGDGEPEIGSLQAEFEELSDRHVRLVAEFNNYRRRAERESLGTWGRAQAELLKKFLDVLDDLHRVSGLDPAEESVTVQSIVEGIDLVERKFLRALEEAGAELLDPEPGSVFDPESMEAMMRVPVDDAELDDQVAQVFHKGYRVDGNLVRPARVSVYKAD